MDKLPTSIGGQMHDEHQPPHLVITDPSICADALHRGVRQSLPALLSAACTSGRRTAAEKKVRSTRHCVHCKTCDIADPYQIIEWSRPKRRRSKYIDM